MEEPQPPEDVEAEDETELPSEKNADLIMGVRWYPLPASDNY